uniref:Rho-GAP domain-containing protein n=1 Tax=Eptatretus burgeri TaxID=7764 RepID=A0A8C4QM53_EPTBU
NVCSVVTTLPVRWNEIVTSFRNSMPRRRHRQGLRTYPASFTAGEATTWLLAHLSAGTHFGPDVSRGQTLRLLCKFLQTHVIEDVKGRWGSENFTDDHHLYSMAVSRAHYVPQQPIMSVVVEDVWKTTTLEQYVPLVPPPPPSRLPPSFSSLPSLSLSLVFPPLILSSSYISPPSRPPSSRSTLSYPPPPFVHMLAIHWLVVFLSLIYSTRELSFRRMFPPEIISAIWMLCASLQSTMELKSLTGLLNCAAVDPKHIMHNISVTNKQGVVLLHNKHEFELQCLHECLHVFCVLSVPCICHALGPKHNSEVSSYSGFEKDVFQTIAEFFQNLKEPLIPYSLYELVINVLGKGNIQAASRRLRPLQLSSLLFPPASRRRLQLLLRLLGRISRNPELFSMLCPSDLHIRDMLTRTFWSCVLRSPHTSHLDELLAYRLLSFLLEHYEEVLRVPTRLRAAVEARLFQLHHQQVMQPSYSFCRQITVQEFQEQAGTSSHTAIERLLESIASDQNMDPRLRTKHLKQFQKAYPDIYRQRFGVLHQGLQPLAERRGLGDSVGRRPCQVQRKSSLRW